MAKKPLGKKNQASVRPQKPLKAKPESRTEKETLASPSYYLPITSEIRSLASSLSSAFRKVYGSPDGNGRKADLINLRVAPDSIERAENLLKWVALVQLQTQLPSAADFRDRLAARSTTIANFQEMGFDVVSGKCSDSRSETQKETIDNLTHPIVLRDRDGANKSFLIFFGPYLPTELEAFMADLAETSLKDCPVSPSVLNLLKAFHECFTGIEIIRVDPIIGDPKLKATIIAAHAELLVISERIIRGALAERPHRIEIHEFGNNGLTINIDGKSLPLTRYQEETIVVLALLSHENAISAERFVDVSRITSGKPSQTFLNRRNSLSKMLPRLKFQPRNGNHEMQGVVFGAVPSDQRLKEFIDGSLAPE